MIGHNLAVLTVISVVLLAILRLFAHRREASLFSSSRLLMGFSAVVAVVAIRRGAPSLYALALIAAVWGISRCLGVLTKRKGRPSASLKSGAARS